MTEQSKQNGYPDPFNPPTWQEFKERWPERAKNTAYHEAGHAVMARLFGEEAFAFISMEPSREAQASCHGRNNTSSVNPFWFVAMADALPASLRQRSAAQTVMVNLGGPSAEARRMGCPAAEWLEALADESGIGVNDMLDDPPAVCDFTDDPLVVCDFTKAVLVAQKLYPDSIRRRAAFLRRVAGWCDEAFADDRVWRMTEHLAAKLLTVSRISFDDAWAIMDNAWGVDQGGSMLIYRLGRNFRRRFRVSVEPGG